MAERRGGYRRPGNPAPVSGPGKFSQRTDGQPSVDNAKQAAQYISGMPYGEGQEINAIAGAAPLSAAPNVPKPSSLTSLTAPSDRPEELVTTPANEPVAAPESMVPEADSVADFIRAAYAAFPSPTLRNLIARLNQEGR